MKQFFDEIKISFKVDLKVMQRPETGKFINNLKIY